jgi:Zn-dependent protease with chaperone function
VIERSSLSTRLREARQRSLLLRVGALYNTTRQPLRANLAHEHSHLSHRDTASGGPAMTMPITVLVSIVPMAQSATDRRTSEEDRPRR